MAEVERVTAIHTVDNLRASSGGPSRSVTGVCDALARAGAAVTLLAAELNSEALLVRPHQPEVQLNVLATNARHGLLRGRRAPFGHAVDAAALGRRAAVVHSHGLWTPSNRAAALAARRAALPYVVSPKGMLSHQALRVKAAKKRLGWQLYQRRALQMASAFQATSEAEAADIRRCGFRQPVAVIPHGVSVPDVPTRRSDREVKTALFMSRFHPIKGVLELVEAWAQVRPLGWRLRLVGPDEDGHRSQVEQRIAERGLSKSVETRGPAGEHEKADLFASADLFVLATHSENFGIVVAEALASGLPVITTHGAPWQALETERCGWWVASESFALALSEATSTSPAVLQKMGERGRVYVEATLSWDRAGADHLALYRWLLGRGPRPASIV